MVIVGLWLICGECFALVFSRMVEQKLPERAVTLFMKACEVAEVGPFFFLCKLCYNTSLNDCASVLFYMCVGSMKKLFVVISSRHLLK